MIRTHHTIVLRAVSLLFALASFVTPLVLSGSVHAQQITERSLTLEGVGSTDTTPGPITYVGGSTPGGVVNHHFKWKVGENHTIGSIKIEYCATADDLILPTCTLPTGINTDAGGVSLAANTGDVTGFTLNKTTNGTPYLTRSPASVTAGDDVDFVLGGVTNPSTVGTFFVRLSTYASIDTTGSFVDKGNVAASTAQVIQVEGTMPESLIFCTGGTIPTANNCASATSGSIYFDRLFSPLDTATATSQFAVSTNAGFGYNVTVNGPTLSSGTNFIGVSDSPAVGMAKGAPALGISQFGLNLKLNSTTLDINSDPLGLEKDSVGNPAPVIGAANANYATVDEFKYASGDIIAASAGATNWERFTVSYIANVPGAQAAGTYVTTLTYLATPTF